MNVFFILVISVLSLFVGSMIGAAYMKSVYSSSRKRFKADLDVIREKHQEALDAYQSKAIADERQQLTEFRKELDKLALEEMLIHAEMPASDQLN